MNEGYVNSLVVGSGTTGQLSVAADGGGNYSSVNIQTNNSFTIGSGAGSNGQVSVSLSNGGYVSLYADTFDIGSGSGANGRLSVDFADGNNTNFYIGTNSTQIGVGIGGGTGQLDFNLPPQTAGTWGGQAQVWSSLLIGDGSGSVGVLNVLQTGKNRTLAYPSSTVSLQTGSAIVGSSGGTGTANVDGGGWYLRGDQTGAGHDGLHIGLGAGSTGTVNVLSGGKVTYSPDYPNVGTPAEPFGVVVGEAGGTGTLNVIGANEAAPSTVTTGAGLIVGYGAGSNGGLNILSGGKVASYNSDMGGDYNVQPAQIGASGGSGSVVVADAGSVLNIGGRGNPYYNSVCVDPSCEAQTATTATGDLFVGVTGGTGSLTLANGGVANIGTVAFTQTYDSNTSVQTWSLAPSDSNGIVYLAQDAGSAGALNFGAPAGQGPQAPGTLNAAGVVFGQGTGAIVFNHTSSNFQFNTPISGEGAIDVIAGTTIIGVDNSAGFSHERVNFDPSTYTSNTVTETFSVGFSGSTNMYGGTLILANNGAIGSSTVYGLGNATLGYGLDGLSIGNTIAVNSGVTLSLLADAGVSATQTGAISGAGNIDKVGAGTLTLTAVNPITGEVVIDAGTLALSGASQVSEASRVVANATFDISGVSSGASIQSLAGGGTVSLGGQRLTLTAANDSFSGVIQGTGGFTLSGGTETLSGTNTYSGATNVNAGTLNVEGSIASSSLTTVNAGAVLMGTGTVGNTVIETDGVLLPGNGTPGTVMTVSGNLTFQSGAQYVVNINPATSSLTNVSGTATLGGATVNAVYTDGSYVPKRYTILTTGSGVNGTFDGLVNTNLPSNFSPSLTYDANNAYLDLALSYDPSGPDYGRHLNINQRNVANTLVDFFNRTDGIPLAFGALSPAGLTQVSGELATGTQQTTFDAMTQFMGVMTDASGAGRDFAACGDAGAANYSKAPRTADCFASRWNVWAAGYGGGRTTDGNAVIGSNTATSRVYGVAVGADYRISPDTWAGFALAGGGTNFSLANALGSGRSDLFQAGAFVHHDMGAAYVTGALAYGWQDITTDRNVTVDGLDRLRARFNANAFSGRLESGYRFATVWGGLTPYAAGQFTTYDLPAYAEQALVGTNTFALAYGAKTVTESRSELGLRSDKSFAMDDGVLTLRGRLAWAHNFDPNPSIAAAFQTLPGTSFVVNGASIGSNSALTTASAEMTWRNGWSTAVTFEGEFSNVTSSYAGKGVLRYRW